MSGHPTLTKEKNPFLEWALYYAREKHWAVFPLAPHQKIPRKGSRGLLEATTDEAQIRKWWQETPAANIGVRTGDGIFALDEDPRHGGDETLAKLVEEHGAIAGTLEAVTPNRGRHRVYLAPEQVEIPTRAPVRNDWPGLDVRGSGGYIAVHPSMVVNDRGQLVRYDWDGIEGELTPVAAADSWLVEAILATVAANGGNGAPPVELPETLERGSRDQTIYRMACSFRRARAEYETVLAHLIEYDRKHCAPPLGERVVKAKVDSAWKKPAGDGKPAEVSDPFLALPSVWSYEVTARYIAADLLEEGTVTMWTGESGDGKSTLALALAAAVARGTLFLGRTTTPRMVVYLDRENPVSTVKDRLFRLRIPDISGRLKIWGGWWIDHEPPGPGGAPVLAIAGREKPLFIFDSLIAFAGCEENSAREMRAHMMLYRKLAALGATVLVIHHTSDKGESDYRGSSDIRAVVDAAWRISRDDNSTAGDALGRLLIRPYKTRTAPGHPIRIEYLNDRFEALDAPPRSPIEIAVDLVRSRPGATQSELRQLAARQGLGQNRLCTALDDAVLARSILAQRGRHNTLRYYPSDTYQAPTI